MMSWAIGILFIVLIFSGIPMLFALGVTAAVFMAISGAPLNTIPQRMVGGLNSFPIMAIPLFILAGQIMERGGIAKRLVDFAQALVGWITGSLLLVAILAGTGFAAVSGSGSASTAAISSIMLPGMRKRGYDIDFAAVMMAATGVMGPIIPPSIMMIVLATCSSVPISVEDLFMGGVIPGLIMSAGLMIYSWFVAKKGGAAYREDEPFTLARLIKSAVIATPALCMPVIIVGGIVGGLCTPTEAAALAVFAGLIISIFIYRELSFKELPTIIIRSTGISASVMMIIATAGVFSWLIASNHIPEVLAQALIGFSDSPIVFLLMINVMLLIIGMFMESNSAILILIPVLMPVAVNHFGLDPVHLGVVIVANLCVGMLTPPYGICLFVAANVSGRNISQLIGKVWWPITILVGCLLLITYVPSLVTWLPGMIRGG